MKRLTDREAMQAWDRVQAARKLGRPLSLAIDAETSAWSSNEVCRANMRAELTQIAHESGVAS